MSKQVSLVFCYNDKQELLLGERKDNGRFTLPGGHLEDNESPEDGARRELLEETGLDALSLSPLLTQAGAEPSGDAVTLHVFSAYVSPSSIPHSDNDPDNEVSKWEFVDVSNGLPENIANNLHGPADIDRNVVKKLFDKSLMSRRIEHSYPVYSETITKAEHHEDEVFRLLNHPDPNERTLALRMGNVSEKHLQHAALDPDPAVHSLAIVHPAFGRNAGLYLMEADADHAGKHPTVAQETFLSKPEGVTAAHLDAAHANAKRNPEASRVLHSILVQHPGLHPELAEALYHDPQVSFVHRLQLLDHPQVPVSVLDHAIQAGSTMPGDQATALAKKALVHPNMAEGSVQTLVKQALSSKAPWIHDLAEHALSKAKTPTSVIDHLLKMGPVSPGLEHAFLRAAAVSGPSATPAHVDMALADRNPLVWKNLHGATLLPRHVDSILNRLLTEHPRDLEAIKRLSDHPLFNEKHLSQVLANPLSKSEELSKSVDPGDFKSMVKALDPKGSDLVDHKPHLSAHPDSHGAHVAAYKEQVLDSEKKISRKSGNGGITRKVVLHARVSGHEGASKYIVKPYHERPVRRLKGWVKHPHQGWAEMTNQALYHAAGIGHLHQKVHVAEHNMGPGHEKEPALVVHMEPDQVDQYRAGRLPGGAWDVDPDEDIKQVHQDVRKIAMMDFLTNNLDRHGGNLLQSKDRRHVLAIDHSRSFQYMSPRDDEVKWGHKKGVNPEDTFGEYHWRSSLDHASPFASNKGKSYDRDMDSLESYAPIFDWWGQHSDNVKKAFAQHIEQIKDPQIRAHIARNFGERAKWLDERANLGLENYGTDWSRDPVQMYAPDQLTEQGDRELRDRVSADEYRKQLEEARDKLHKAIHPDHVSFLKPAPDKPAKTSEPKPATQSNAQTGAGAGGNLDSSSEVYAIVPKQEDSHPDRYAGYGYKGFLNKHPSTNQASVDAFRKHVIKPEGVVEPYDVSVGPSKDRTNNGVMDKSVYKTPEGKFMVKPFWENRDPSFPGAGAGWSEMANQALYHAAGIGHLHQKVHVEMMPHPEGKDMPATVTHMDPGVDWIEDYKRDHLRGGPAIPDSTKADMSKIHVMDYLTNNYDRHVHNLMISPDGKRVLAIDHGYSFNVDDGDVDYNHRSNAAHVYGEGKTGVSHFGRSGIQFWGQNRDKIRMEFQKHLKMLHPDVAKAKKEGFEARAKHLDNNVNYVNMRDDEDGSDAR